MNCQWQFPQGMEELQCLKPGQIVHCQGELRWDGHKKQRYSAQKHVTCNLFTKEYGCSRWMVISTLKFRFTIHTLCTHTTHGPSLSCPVQTCTKAPGKQTSPLMGPYLWQLHLRLSLLHHVACLCLQAWQCCKEKELSKQLFSLSF